MGVDDLCLAMGRWLWCIGVVCVVGDGCLYILVFAQLGCGELTVFGDVLLAMICDGSLAMVLLGEGRVLQCGVVDGLFGDVRILRSFVAMGYGDGFLCLGFGDGCLAICVGCILAAVVWLWGVDEWCLAMVFGDELCIRSVRL